MKSNQVPLWQIAICILISLLGLFVGLSLYTSPETFIPEVNFSAPGVGFITKMWAARQISIALVIAFSALKKSSPMLRASLACYCIMNIQDVGIGLSQKDIGLASGAAFFSALSAALIFLMRTRK